MDIALNLVGTPNANLPQPLTTLSYLGSFLVVSVLMAFKCSTIAHSMTGVFQT